MLWLYLSTIAVGLALLAILFNGSKASIDKLPASNSHEIIKEWSDKYGGMFKVKSWGSQYVIISDPSIARKVLMGKQEQPRDPADYAALTEMLHGTTRPSILTSSQDDYWRAARNCVAHSFARGEVAWDFQVACVKACALAGVLAQRGRGVVVDVSDLALRLSLDVLGVAQLGYDFQAVTASGDVLVLKLLKQCMEELQRTRRMPLRNLMRWFSDDVAAQRQKYEILRAFAAQLWDSIIARGPPPDEDVSLAAQLIRLRDPATAQPLPSSHIASELLAFLLSGTLHTGHALAWALYCLAANPAAQEQLSTELQQSGLLEDLEHLTYEAVGEVPYLDAVVQESLRLYPAAASGTIRKAQQDLQLGTHHVPKGTSIWVHTYSLHRSSRVWENPEEFDPGRWLHTSGAGRACPVHSHDGGGDASGGRELEGGGDAGSSGASGSDTLLYDGLRTAAGIEAGSTSKALSGHTQGADSTADVAAEAAAAAAAEQAATAEHGKATAQTHNAYARHGNPGFMPFGMGAHACVGQALAVAAIKATLAVLVGCFSFELSAPGTAAYASAINFSLGPSKSLPLMVAERRLS